MALDQNKNIGGKTVAEWVAQIPAIGAAVRGEETAWLNESKPSFAEAMAHSELTAAHVKDASDRLARFAGYFMRVFPETAENGGMIESPLRAIPHMQDAIRCKYGAAIDGELWIKLDSHLPISGSIKARGGIYEVLSIAEGIAMREGGLKETDDYAVLAEPTFRDLFSTYEIAVGSTGNLGLSIGIMSAKLGFRVTVHMSADARQWKKDMLRSRGVTVVEYEDDYSVAVENGRRAAEGNPRCYFIDDENSRTLFLGYSVAAERLKKQLDAEGVHIDGDNPLYVYLPCGVGGGPGGVAFGLKLQFGDAVHCFFAEPTHSCCMLLGMATGLHNGVATSDFGIDNRTVADGLAVGRASGFVGKQMYDFMDGCYTVRDERMNALLKMLCDEEGLRLEPSALAGMFGPVLVGQRQGGYHLVWATGGSMVPDEEYQKYYRAGEAACKSF